MRRESIFAAVFALLMLAAAAMSQVGQQPGVTTPPGVATSVSAAAYPLVPSLNCFTGPPYSFSGFATHGLCHNGLGPVLQTAPTGQGARISLNSSGTTTMLAQGLSGTLTGLLVDSGVAMSPGIRVTVDGVAKMRVHSSGNGQGVVGTKGSAVASAAVIVSTGNVFHVTGTTTIDTISAGSETEGKCMTVIFDGALTVGDLTGNIDIGAPFTSTAKDTLSLCYDGTNWFETGRSVN